MKANVPGGGISGKEAKSNKKDSISGSYDMIFGGKCKKHQRHHFMLQECEHLKVISFPLAYQNQYIISELKSLFPIFHICM